MVAAATQIQALTGLARDVVILRFGRGYTHSRVAEMVGCSSATVRRCIVELRASGIPLPKLSPGRPRMIVARAASPLIENM